MHVQYVSVIAWVFDFRKFIAITDVSVQAMCIACVPIAGICSQHGLTHESIQVYVHVTPSSLYEIYSARKFVDAGVHHFYAL